jgi:uncharacterized membrane protein YhaH (DUF805 family)
VNKLRWYLFDFSGRASILQMWITFAAYFIVGIPLFVLLGAVVKPELAWVVPLIGLVPVAWLKIAVGIKRLHDLGYPGTYLLLGLIPLVNLFLLQLYLKPGVVEPNQWGAKAKGW